MTNNNYPVDLPKTYTVSYFNEAEWNKDLTPQEIQQQQEIADLQNRLGGNEKGYGPCSDHRCYSSNSDACQRDSSGNIVEFFYDLYIPCPTVYCSNRINKVKTYWVHDNPGCGRNTDMVSNKARIRCPDCFNTSHIRYHSFKCSEHKDDPKNTTSTTFGDALFVIYNDDKIPPTVIAEILAELAKEKARSGW